jgi:hypothetical protein
VTGASAQSSTCTTSSGPASASAASTGTPHSTPPSTWAWPSASRTGGNSPGSEQLATSRSANGPLSWCRAAPQSRQVVVTVSGTASSDRSCAPTWDDTSRRSGRSSSSASARLATAVATPRTCVQRDGDSTRRLSLSAHQRARSRARRSDGSLARKAAFSAPAEQP